MKCEIFCIRCGEISRKDFPTNEPFPGEYVEFKKGIALKDFVCDQCGKDVNEGELCYAFSNWTDRQERLDWENSYIFNIE